MKNLMYVFALFCLVGVILIITAKFSREKEFDEREQLVRGRAYHFAYSAIILFEAFHVILLLALGRPVMADGVSSILAIFFSIAVFAVFCIREDAFKTMRNERARRRYMILLALVVVLNLIGGLSSLKDDSLVQDGVLQMPVTSFACAFTFFVVLIAMGAKQLRERKEAEE